MSIESKVKEPSFTHEEKMAVKFVHIDEWLDMPTMRDDEAYAKFVLDYKRLPAWKQIAYRKYMQGFELYCTHKGHRYRVMGASRLGDIWLADDLKQESGYDHCVEVMDCSQWSDKP